MDKNCFVENVKGMVFDPRINALPVLTLVFNVEIWLWCSIIVNPVESQE